MIVLAIESSTAAGSVAIARNGTIVAFEKSMNQRAHSEFINPAIDSCLQTAGLQLSQIDLFAVGIGPGSFTGIRVALNIGTTFAMTFQKPMVAMTSLDLLLQEARLQGTVSKKTICLLNAHKNMCYFSLYEKDNVVLGPIALPVKEIAKMDFSTDDLVLGLGEGFVAYEKTWDHPFLKQIFRASKVSDHPLATTLAICAHKQLEGGQTIEWKSVKPLYIRASEAEENLRLKT